MKTSPINAPLVQVLKPTIRLVLWVALTIASALITKAAEGQTIAWSSPGEEWLTLNQAYPLAASASSGLPVTYRVMSGPAAIDTGANPPTLTVTGLGTVWVAAEQAGDANWAPVSKPKLFNLTSVGLTQTGEWPGYRRGVADGVCVQGNYAYVAAAEGGLVIMDLTNPANPQRVGWVDLPAARRVQVVGTLAYVSHGGTLQVVDVSDPTQPKVLGWTQTSGQAIGLRVVGQLAYVAAEWGGLQIIDVSDPVNPLPVGGYDTSGQALGVEVVGHLAYVADGYSGLHVIDVQRPANPVRVGGYDTSGYAREVRVVGNLAYVADDTAGLQIIDVSAPASLVRVGGYDTQANAWDVQLVGSLAYVADWWGGLVVVDVSDPGNPALKGQLSLNCGESRTVQVAGGLVYVAAGGCGLVAIQVADPANPQVAGTGATYAAAQQVRVVGDRAYVADDLGGLAILDVSGPGNPVKLGEQTSPRWTVGLDVVAQRAYLARGGSGLQIMDVANPANPTLLGTLPVNAYRVQVTGDRAYVACDWDGLQIGDVSNPALPVRLGGYRFSVPAHEVRAFGNLAYVAADAAGLNIMDVSDPASPVRLGVLDGIGNAWAVDVVGTVAYVAVTDPFRGLQIVDVSDPAHPRRLGGVPLNGECRGVQVVGNLAYVAAGWDGVQVVDVTVPTDPRRVGGTDGLWYVFDVTLDNGRVWASSSFSGLKVLSSRAGRAQTLDFNPSNWQMTQSPVTLTGTASSGLPVTFEVVSGPATVSGNQLTLTHVGYVTLRAKQAGDATWLPGSVERVVQVTKPQQTIEFAPPELARLSDSTVRLSATASSGLPVTFEIVNGPASLNGDDLILAGAGNVTVRAAQAGDSLWLPASVERTIIVTADANLLLNGDFELPGLTGSALGITTVPGWTVSAGTVDLNALEGLAHTGRQFLETVGTPGAATLSQTFPTDPGRMYVFSGWMSHHAGVGAARIEVALNDGVVGYLTHGLPLVEGNLAWQRFAVEFEATATSTTLKLIDVTGVYENGGGMLDTLAVLPSANSNPQVVSVNTEGHPDRVRVGFSKRVNPVTALVPGNYSFDCGVQVAAVELGADQRSVYLHTMGSMGPLCKLAVTGVTDLATPPNPVDAGIQVPVITSQGVITRRVFRNIGGETVANLVNNPRFPGEPDEVTYETSFEAPRNFAENYGQQMVGYIHPPVTGDYIFHLASDDGSVLYLSPDEHPEHKQQIATFSIAVGPHEWNQGVMRVAAEDVFKPGTFIIEAEDFNHGGGQHEAVADQMPYLGGAYAGKSAVAEIDYHDPGANESGIYRATDQGVGLAYAYRQEESLRGTYTVSPNYRIGWNAAGDWYNYTRQIPPGQYRVFARITSGPKLASARLDLVSNPGAGEQLTTPLGTFFGSGTRNYDKGALVPLTDASGEMVVLSLGGEQTFRFTLLNDGDPNLDFLAFVPANGPAPAYRAESVSLPIHLEAGHKYYIEALMKEKGGGDNLAVAWQMPGAPPVQDGDAPIPGIYLSSLHTDGIVTLAHDLPDAVVQTGQSHVFELEPAGTPPYGYRWFRDGAELAGQTEPWLVLSGLGLADSGARFRVEVRNALGAVLSREALLTVVADTFAPTLAEVSGTEALSNIVVRFNEPVQAISAVNLANYALSGGLTVTAAQILPDAQTVVLTTSIQQEGMQYTLEVSGVLDVASIPNVILPNSQAVFTAWARISGVISHDYFTGIPSGNLGVLLADPRFPWSPTSTEQLISLEWPVSPYNDGSLYDYGDRAYGWLIPPMTGDYVFYLAADDNAQVYLSSDGVPANKVLICSEPVWNNPRDYRVLARRNPDEPENVSLPIRLQAGHRYYFEALHKEGGGGDHFALAWRMPGQPEVKNGDDPIPAQYFETRVDPDRVGPRALESLPAYADARGDAFTLTVRGEHFTAGAVVLWNGLPRPTTFVKESELTAVIPASDLDVSGELTTVSITVKGFGGLVSPPLPFVLAGVDVEQVETAVAASGQTVVASTAPTAEGEAGVVAELENTGDPTPVTVSTATYTVSPAPGPESGTFFDVGGGYVDVQVNGADATDVATSKFYYPTGITGDAETELVLLYFNGAGWVPVLSSGGMAPVKDTTDHLNGTLSGGRFTVVFDGTSTPKITELTGTVFATFQPNTQPPVAVEDPVVLSPGVTAKISVRELLANDSDSDGDVLHVTGCSARTTRGGIALVRGAWVFYTPPAGFMGEDIFDITVSDGRGGLSTSHVRVTVGQGDLPSQNLLSLAYENGKVILRFAGIPGRNYIIQYRESLDSGTPWQELGHRVCPYEGLMVAEDGMAGGIRFYRTIAQP